MADTERDDGPNKLQLAQFLSVVAVAMLMWSIGWIHIIV